MALKATICKAELHIADMERHYYQTHSLTIARHPSENDERMMLRVLVFALHASESLTFTKGISTADEPDIWEKALNSEINCWIDLGQPDENGFDKPAVKHAVSGFIITAAGQLIHGGLSINQFSRALAT